MATKKAQEYITRIAGPVIYARMQGAVNDLVRIGEQGLLGEIIEVRGDECVIQVYEDTTGLQPKDPVVNTKNPLSVQLGPGLLGSVFDGTQRPLNEIREQSGTFIARGMHIDGLNQKKKWPFTPVVKNGETVAEGQLIGTVQENELIEHRVLVPVGVHGKISGLKEGNYTVSQTIATVGKENISLMRLWPVRKPRPVRSRKPVMRPLVTGQRVLDFMFPIAKGGAGAIPGPFGAGKTVTQQQIAKWSDADVIVYIGCGERGNEMTEVLEEFPHLKDAKSGAPLMNRTVLIANTSNMPVAAREASIYTGITIAEYFRDQGYAVALMADSTSRWAEAMREISGRLEEMPGEEGYPAYLAKRLAEFYERAGMTETLSGHEGSISIIGAVSPAGGDFSEPVTQNTLRLTRCFWALDAKLADRRHYPSINWLGSYSLYVDTLDPWFNENVADTWSALRTKAASLLQEESELQEIVQLVGIDSLPKEQQAKLLAAKLVREDFLQQNAFSDIDTYCPPEKQAIMMHLIFDLYDALVNNIATVNLESVRNSDAVETIGRLKETPNNEFSGKNAEQLIKTVRSQIRKVTEGRA